ncbi:uncharacterized protein LOC62_04G006144 [Vanrija pseudolonga]|uniref:Ribosomal protein/NADH dehydrogenase domain-containing protein n=1 Tax=Vanrija pseudolonga TaxID=143232 RepID=A0AAF1BJE8_9TREE|nr:hypothetical protein LOC62_04G006144 [Vanrija pseudolonga]
MPPAPALRRLPLREAIAALSSGEGATRLSPAVKGLSISFVQKNAEPGPRNFLRTIAPRIAYANPTLPIAITRYKDPRTKSLDPNSPDAGAAPWADGAPGPSLTVSFHERPEQTVPLRHLSADQIWKQVLSVCGEAGDLGIEAPKEEVKAAEVEGEVKAEPTPEAKAEAAPEAKA